MAAEKKPMSFGNNKLSSLLVEGKIGVQEAYERWADSYDADMESMNYSGYKSVVEKWIQYHSNLDSTAGVKHKVFDAGCGTGLAGEVLMKSMPTEHVELFGGDFSSEMLKIAKTKGVYTDLQATNLTERLPYDEDSFDSVICAGVLGGTNVLGSECLPNIVRILKPGSYFITTLNLKFKLFEQNIDTWKKKITEYHCELLEENKIPYISWYTESNVVLLVIKKHSDSSSQDHS